MPRFGGFSPGAGQFAGWYQYMDRDCSKLLHIHQPLTTMRYAHRPTGIQQVISFNRHDG